MNNSNKYWITIGAGLIMMTILANCAVKVNTSYDPSASFKDYKTFCWFDNCEFTIEGPFYVNKDSASVKQFQNSIVDELQRKGYIYDQNNPDFLLHMHVVVKEQEGIMSSPYQDGDPDYWQDAFPFGTWGDRTYVYLEGSIIIDIADAEESKMVWRSDAVEYMDVTTDITDSQLRRGIRKILKKFPPKAAR